MLRPTPPRRPPRCSSRPRGRPRRRGAGRRPRSPSRGHRGHGPTARRHDPPIRRPRSRAKPFGTGVSRSAGSRSARSWPRPRWPPSSTCSALSTSPAQIFLLVALGLCGLGVVAGAVAGRVRGPLALGTATALALVAVSIVSVPVGGGVGERTFRPSTAAELEPEYRLGAGELVLDLRDVGVRPVNNRSRPASASAGCSSSSRPARRSRPTAARRWERSSCSATRRTVSASRPPPWAADSTPSFFTQPGRLVLDLEVGLGRVETRVADPVAAPSPRPATPRARAEARSAPDPRTGRSARGSAGLRG